MIGWVLIFLLGFALGVFIRGAYAKGRIADLLNERREAELITEIEAERLKQHRMIDERMQP
jgi:hypothetical protein